MEALISLVARNNKMFRRDKTQVFFSLLSIIIVIALYGIFLQKMQVDAIEQVTKATPETITMVNEWLVAGLLSMIAVTTTLGAFGIAIQDLESKSAADFLTAPISRAKIQLSYVLNAFFIGFIFSFIAFIACEIFIVATGGQLLNITEMVKVIGILILSVLLASTLNMFLVLFVHSQNAYSTLTTIVGTVIGFLCGVYVPFGVLPGFAQNLIMYFPISHTTVLLREAFMQNSIQTVFAGASNEQIEAYKINYGIVYKMNGNLLASTTSLLIIVGTTIVFAALSILIFKKRNK
ncbi:ABC transporter permease [Solibacillus sp. MA9]|uniref:Transport permease protein n=1 Tax=Solibacillus palustris TaxID=2908203 RepID=A0ABS9UHR9_9BACL|nr:ABC transporter permease [Solibacillus sp. MA9]MCH7323915.1 ABC transporter permease [Solibacillus sp. MA9]